MIESVIAAHPSYRPSTKEEIRALESRVRTRFHCVSCCTPAYYVITLGNWNISVAYEYPPYEKGPTEYYILKGEILETLIEDWIAHCVKKGKPWANEKILPLTSTAEAVVYAT